MIFQHSNKSSKAATKAKEIVKARSSAEKHSECQSIVLSVIYCIWFHAKWYLHANRRRPPATLRHHPTRQWAPRECRLAFFFFLWAVHLFIYQIINFSHNPKHMILVLFIFQENGYSLQPKYNSWVKMFKKLQMPELYHCFVCSFTISSRRTSVETSEAVSFTLMSSKSIMKLFSWIVMTVVFKRSSHKYILGWCKHSI